MAKYLPIEGTEITQLQFMHSLFRCMNEDDSLKNRFSHIKIWWRYKGMLKQLYNMFDAAWKTIDPATRAKISAVWDVQELRIVYNSTPIDPSGDKLLIPKETINLWGAHCQKESCEICMGNHSDRAKCKFRKGMSKMALLDLRREEKLSGKCMGKIFNFNS